MFSARTLLKWPDVHGANYLAQAAEVAVTLANGGGAVPAPIVLSLTMCGAHSAASPLR
jgi:hypothetical protein